MAKTSHEWIVLGIIVVSYLAVMGAEVFMKVRQMEEKDRLAMEEEYDEDSDEDDEYYDEEGEAENDDDGFFYKLQIA